MTEETSKPRARASNVRETILKLLAKSSMTMEEMSSQGSFSVQSGFLNVKKLKEEGVLMTVREGRSVRYVLNANGAAVTPKTAKPGKVSKAGKIPGKKGRPSGKTAVGGEETLKSALKTVMGHLMPITELQEKVGVLDQLIGALPKAVGSVLSKIKDDLNARSGVISGGG